MKFNAKAEGVDEEGNTFLTEFILEAINEDVAMEEAETMATMAGVEVKSIEEFGEK